MVCQSDQPRLKREAIGWTIQDGKFEVLYEMVPDNDNAWLGFVGYYIYGTYGNECMCGATLPDAGDGEIVICPRCGLDWERRESKKGESDD